MKELEEAKAEFSAGHWGMQVFIEASFTEHLSALTGIDIDNLSPEDYLLLTPLSQISDEDAIGLMRCHSFISGNPIINSVSISNGILIIDYYYGGNTREIYNIKLLTGHQTSYFRGQAYALDHYSRILKRVVKVEEQLELGWIKLREV